MDDRGHDKAVNRRFGWKTGRRWRWMWRCGTWRKRRSQSLRRGTDAARWSRPRRSDTSTTRRGLLAAARGLAAGISGFLIGADCGPLWPIRLAPTDVEGECTKMGPWGEADILGQSAMQRGRFRRTPDSSSEHLGERVCSGQGKSLDTRLGHLRGSSAPTSRQVTSYAKRLSSSGEVEGE